MSGDENFLLNAPDGIARYEALQELKRRDAAEVVPRLVKMLQEGTARYPQEITALLGEVGGQEALEALRDHPDKTVRHAAARALSHSSDIPTPPRPASGPARAPDSAARERTLGDRIESWVVSVGATLKIDQKRAQRAHQKLVEIGAPAVPALVNRLYDPAAKKHRFAVLQVLGEIARNGAQEAIDALQTASQHDDPGIARPASVVLEKLAQGE